MTALRFLIDECLSPRLTGCAHRRGFAASHLRDLGLLSKSDERLMHLILAGDWCFVTRNARDFRGPDAARGSGGLYAKVDLHAGLICLISTEMGFSADRQATCFERVLDAIGSRGGDMTNRLAEARWSAQGVLVEMLDLPSGA